MSDDPNWPRASQWLANGTAERPKLGVLGLPLSYSITAGNCDLAPGAIRKALHQYSLFDPENVTDLTTMAVRDFGDAPLDGRSTDDASPDALAVVADTLSLCEALILLGGDNGITRPGVHALGVPIDRVGLLTFDAHHDVRDAAEGLHNGNPVRALLEDGLPGSNVVQIGIAPFTNSQPYAALAQSAGIHVETCEEVYAHGIDLIVRRSLNKLATTADVIYVDLDVDVLDRAFAPACPGSRPGGLQPWMLRRAARMCGHAPKVRVMDIVEVDPTRDVADVTVLAAASFLLAFASGVAARSS